MEMKLLIPSRIEIRPIGSYLSHKYAIKQI